MFVGKLDMHINCVAPLLYSCDRSGGQFECVCSLQACAGIRLQGTRVTKYPFELDLQLKLPNH